MIFYCSVIYNLRHVRKEYFGFRKSYVIPEQFTLLLIKQKNPNKRFGEFKFEYFGGSDVTNKLDVQ